MDIADHQQHNALTHGGTMSRAQRNAALQVLLMRMTHYTYIFVSWFGLSQLEARFAWLEVAIVNQLCSLFVFLDLQKSVTTCCYD